MLNKAEARRVKKDWLMIENEEISIRSYDEGITAYGSETACLRLACQFAGAPPLNGTVGQCEDWKTWYFKLKRGD